MLVISLNWASKAAMLGWLGLPGAAVPLCAVLAMRRLAPGPAREGD